MKFENYLQRAELISLQNFLKHGGETFIPTSDKKYSERITQARRKAKNFFEEKFPDIDDFDRIYGYFDEQVSEAVGSCDSPHSPQRPRRGVIFLGRAFL